MNNQRFLSCAVVLAGVATLVMWAGSLRAKHWNSGLSTNSHGPINSCDDLDFNFDDHEAVRTEDHFNLPSSASPLEVTAAMNGGLEVIGWDGKGYDIAACKAAAAEDLLKDVSISTQSGRVTAHGPAGDNWTVYFIIKAPNDSAMHLEAHNGPIALRNIGAKIEARSVNGPISLKDVTGEVAAQTQNGPISLEGSGGNLQLETQNGPISVAVAGANWSSGEVTARTHNGPLDLRLPDNFTSGVRVEMSGHCPLRHWAAHVG